MAKDKEEDATSSQEYFQLNSDLNKHLKQFASSFEGLIQNFKNEPDAYNSSKGISFLGLKNMLMIEYLTNMLQLVYSKTSGQKISGNPCVLRLAEIRTVLEKTKSIEFKLKYQIDKLLKIADNTNTDEHDPLSFKANLNNFANGNESNEENENSDEEEEESKEKSSNDDTSKMDGIYRPPKLVPMYNDIDETAEDRERKQMERIKRKAFSSSVIKDLENEYSGAPEEIRNNYANILDNETREEKHKKEYEEDNFVRKPMTKAEMMKVKRLQRGTNLNSLSSFDDARFLLDENINMEDYMKSKKEGKKKSKGQKAKKDKKGKKKGKKIRYT